MLLSSQSWFRSSDSRPARLFSVRMLVERNVCRVILGFRGNSGHRKDLWKKGRKQHLPPPSFSCTDVLHVVPLAVHAHIHAHTTHRTCRDTTTHVNEKSKYTNHLYTVSMVTEMFASHLPAGYPCVAVRPARSCPSADPPDCTLLPDSLKDQEEILMKSNAHTRHKRDIAETIRADLSSGSQTHIELWHAHTRTHTGQ